MPYISRLPRRAYLGAELPGDEEAFTGDGVWIAGVADDSMAARAGITKGDRLHRLAGRPVRSLAELGAALRAAGARATTELVYARGAETIERTVDVIPVPLEDGAAYGEHPIGDIRLRTIATHAAAPRAAIVFIQGIACESIDHALAPDAPLAGLITGWTHAGYDTLRFDKRGVGDSEGSYSDFGTELSDARSVVAAARTDATARGLPLVVCGHSVGGIIAPQLADLVDAIIVYGTPVMQWLACLKDSTRRQLELRGAPDDEISERIAALDTLATRGELNGRSAAYHAQLERVDTEAAWRQVDVPVLVVRGEHDWVVAAGDQARIATLARGDTTIIDVPGLDHLFGAHADREASLRDYGIGTFDPALVAATLPWLDQVRSRP